MSFERPQMCTPSGVRAKKHTLQILLIKKVEFRGEGQCWTVPVFYASLFEQENGMNEKEVRGREAINHCFTHTGLKNCKSVFRIPNCCFWNEARAIQ